MIELFELTEDYRGFKKGSIIQKGSDITEDGIEYFDVTTEMETGDCYSWYDIPNEILIPAKDDDIKKVNDFFNPK